MTSRAYGARDARSPGSHYDVILIVTSFATEMATPTVTDERTDTLPRLIYKDWGIFINYLYNMTLHRPNKFYMSYDKVTTI